MKTHKPKRQNYIFNNAFMKKANFGLCTDILN